MKRNLPCEIHLGEDRYPATTIDIDEHHLRVQCDAKLAPATKLAVHFPAVGDISEFWLETRVVRASVAADGVLALRIVEAPAVYKLLSMPSVELQESAPPASQPQDATSAPVVLLDAGDLAPVASALDALEIEYTRIDTTRAPSAGTWPSAEQLLISSARLTLTHPMPPLLDDGGLVGIAVSETQTRTLVRRVQRLGFRFFVSLPVNADALQTLLREALYRENDKRGTPRLAVGIDVDWRVGLRRHSATLVDVSESGGRLHCQESLEPDTRLRLRIPGAVGRSRTVKLTGRIVRSARRHGLGLPHPYTLALSWEGLDHRSLSRISELLDAHALGPAQVGPPASEPPTAVAKSAPRMQASQPPRRRQSLSTRTLTSPRREAPRARLEGEVVSLDGSDVVEHVLVCRDLSEGGMRIDPHPDLGVGSKLRVALSDPADGTPLVLDAEVVRDAGPAGLGLRFHIDDDALRESLAAWVTRLPTVQTLQPHPASFVFGRIVDG